MRENLVDGPWIGTLASLRLPTTLYRLKQLLERCHRATSLTLGMPTKSGIRIWMLASRFSTKLSKIANTASRGSNT